MFMTLTAIKCLFMGVFHLQKGRRDHGFVEFLLICTSLFLGPGVDIVPLVYLLLLLKLVQATLCSCYLSSSCLMAHRVSASRGWVEDIVNHGSTAPPKGMAGYSVRLLSSPGIQLFFSDASHKVYFKTEEPFLAFITVLRPGQLSWQSASLLCGRSKVRAPDRTNTQGLKITEGNVLSL